MNYSLFRSKLCLSTSVISLTLLSTHVQAHGYLDYPPARQQICDMDGGYWDSTDGSTIPNAACRAAFLESGWTPFVQKPEFSTLVSNYNDQAAVEATIPNGELCSAGDKAKHGIDLPSPDWQKTKLDLTNNGKVTLQYRANTPHNPSFWKVYLTKPNYDSATMPLAWSDLDLIAEFGNLATVELNGKKYYQMEVTLPTDRTGDAILYTRWQRQDPAGEGFYNCSDVSFTGNDDGTDPNNPLDKWVSSGNYLASTMDANAGDTAWLRIFDENGQEIVFEKFPIDNDAETVWAESLATTVNQKYPQTVQIGLKDSASQTIQYQSQDLYSNLVYVTNSNYSYQLEIKTGNQAPVITAPSNLSVQSGESLVFEVSATDADNDPLIFSVDKGNIITQSDTSITVNYQAPETTTTLNESIVVSVGDPITTSQSTISITVTPLEDDGNNNGETTWDSAIAYNSGDVVLYNGVSYTAKWWTQGDQPDTSSAWQAAASDNAEWQADKVYTSGDTVNYHGASYKAQWWTQGDEPTSGGPWAQI
ncbi:lytic polysaccharide monooxygenase [Vibrio sp. CK2-1]|uniref:lytic polysaccharide monooxygenase n=1 Tax=Vibrio sp. CK2-1 TaxID=2912249 RepID=UPI001F47CF8A|nr:lytic polysaccharide monooxygenase [Vibrio sp. CK2-1]MCF7353886.1 lytic polysaccharide monooxygenase [Vibrio sp. CK2-1]